MQHAVRFLFFCFLVAKSPQAQKKTLGPIWQKTTKSSQIKGQPKVPPPHMRGVGGLVHSSGGNIFSTFILSVESVFCPLSFFFLCLLFLFLNLCFLSYCHCSCCLEINHHYHLAYLHIF